jgi:hypothetical protein
MGLLPKGMPGVYAQGLIGAENYKPPDIDEYRTLNRESFDINKLFPKLDDEESREGAVFQAVQGVMIQRYACPQFDRTAPEPVVIQTLNPAVLAVILAAPDASTFPIVCILNVSDQPISTQVSGLPEGLMNTKLCDALEGYGGAMREKHLDARSSGGGGAGAQSRVPGWKADLSISLAPYEVLWLKKNQGERGGGRGMRGSIVSGMRING